MAAPKNTRGRGRTRRSPDPSKVAADVQARIEEENEKLKKSLAEEIAAEEEKQQANSEASEQSPDVNTGDVVEAINIKSTLEEEPMAKKFDESDAPQDESLQGEIVQEEVFANAGNGQVSSIQSEMDDALNDEELDDLHIDDDDVQPTSEEGLNEEEVKLENKDFGDGEGKKEKVTKGEYEGGLDGLTGLLKKDEKSMVVLEKSRTLVPLLQNNVFLKLFVTKGAFGRSFVYSNVGTSETGKHGEFKISVLKPGRAKSVVISVPKAFVDTLSKGDSNSSVSENILAVRHQVEGKTAEEKEMVDIAVDYYNMSQYIAMLMEGRIAEFGGEHGPMAYNHKKQDKETRGALDVQINLTKTIDGLSHVMYTMQRPDQALTGKLREEGRGALGEKEQKVITRYREGKVPLKRSSKSASPLYTPKNFVSTIKYDTANPFAADVTDAELKEISAKASFQVSKKDATEPWHDDNKAIKDALIAGKPVPMFDKSTGALEARYDDLVRPMHEQIGNDGKPKQRTHTISKDEYEANKEKYDALGVTVNNNRYSYKETLEKGRYYLSSRAPVDFFTGELLQPTDDIQFVKFTDPIASSKGDGTYNLPKAKRYVLKCEGIDPRTDGRPEVVDVFGLDDPIYANAKNVNVSREVLADALKVATSTQRNSGEASRAQTYDDGLLNALLTAPDGR